MDKSCYQRGSVGYTSALAQVKHKSTAIALWLPWPLTLVLLFFSSFRLRPYLCAQCLWIAQSWLPLRFCSTEYLFKYNFKVVLVYSADLLLLQRKKAAIALWLPWPLTLVLFYLKLNQVITKHSSETFNLNTFY
jgi:hypothetical protein